MEDTNKLEISYEELLTKDLNELKDIEELIINGPTDVVIKRELIDKIIANTNIKVITTDIKIEDSIREENVTINYLFYEYTKYNDIAIKRKRFTDDPKYLKCYQPIDRCEKVLDCLSEVKKDSFTRFEYYTSKENEKDSFSFQYSHDTDWDSETLEKNYHLSFSNVDSIEDVVKVINALKQKNYQIDVIEINLENQDYKDIILLKNIESEYNLRIKYSGSFSNISFEEFVAMRETLNYFKNMILDANLSPLEQITFAYDLIKSFKYRESEDKSNSREIHSIIRDGKIVCVGYAVFFKQLLEELGMEAHCIDTVCHDEKDGKFLGFHTRNIVKVQDDKYGIDGYYAFDATFDSNRNFVDCINENGEKELKMEENVKDTDKIVKYYDGMSLYSCFLVSPERYLQVFTGEKMPTEKDLSNKERKKSSAFITDFNNTIESNRLGPTKFMKLLRTVKEQEGYSGNDLEKLMEEIIDINQIKLANDPEAKHI